MASKSEELRKLVEEQARELRSQPKGRSLRRKPDDAEPEEDEEVEEDEDL
jgi:hypothetical protein